MTTVYKPGDALYERKLHVGRDHQARRIVREWTVLSVVDDPDHRAEPNRPVQVVTLRAFTDDSAIYMADIAPLLDIKITDGTWSRERPEAA